MRRGIERVGGAVRRVGRDAVREVVRVGANVRQVVRRPCALFDVPAFDGGVDRGLVVGIDLGLGRVAGNRDARHDDGRDDPEDRHDGQQFHQRETRSLATTNRFHSSSPNRHRCACRAEKLTRST